MKARAIKHSSNLSRERNSNSVLTAISGSNALPDAIIWHAAAASLFVTNAAEFMVSANVLQKHKLV